MTGVYLIHFSTKLKHAGHYIGFANYIDKRISHHRHGTGAKICAAAIRDGIELIKARVWENADRTFERRLKNYKKTSLLCPICSGIKAEERMKYVQP